MDSGRSSTQFEKLPSSGLTVKLSPCYWLLGIYGLLFLLLVTSVILSPLPPWQQLILVFALCTYGQHLFRKHLLFMLPESVRQLVFTEFDWCYVQFNQGRIIKGNIQRDSIVSEHLVILNLRAQHDLGIFPGVFKRFSVTLTANTVGAEAFRSLKRHLRLLSFAKAETLKAKSEQ